MISLIPKPGYKVLLGQQYIHDNPFIQDILDSNTEYTIKEVTWVSMSVWGITALEHNGVIYDIGNFPNKWAFITPHDPVYVYAPDS